MPFPINSHLPVDSRGVGSNSTSLWTMEELLALGSPVVNERKFEQFVEPVPLLTDFIEIGLLTTVFLVGMPLNAIVFCKLVSEYRKRTTSMQQRDLGTSLTLMKAHLTACNILVLLLFCPFKIMWLATYRWTVGDVLCRWAHLLWLLAFCASSNVVAVIAVDRMRLVYRFGRAQRGKALVTSVACNCLRFAKIMLAIAWAMAVLCSIPQLFVWTTVSFELTSNKSTWRQCTTVWQKQIACDKFHCAEGVGNTHDVPISRLAYHMFHMATVFWLPFVLVFISYAYIVLELMRYACFPYTVIVGGDSSKGNDSIATNEFAVITLTTQTPPSGNSSERISIPSATHMSMTSLNIATRICPIERANGAGTTLDRIVETSSPEMKMQIPLWRSQMRSKMFRTSALIVGCYVICWLPYNVLALGVEISREWEQHISEHAEWAKWFVLLNALVNPFLYGRRKGSCV